MRVQFVLLTLSGIAGGSIAGAVAGTLTPVSVITTAVGSAAAAFAILHVRRGQQGKSQDA